MTLNKNRELIYFHFLKTRPEYFCDIGIDFFKDASIRCLYKVIKSYYQKFKKIATDDVIESILKNKLFEEFMTEDDIDKSVYFNQNLLDTIMDVGRKDIDVEWVKTEFEGYAKNHYIHDAVGAIIELMQNTIVTPDNVEEFRGQIRDIVIQGTSINFDNDLGTNVKDAKTHQSIAKKRFTTGYDYFDKCLDGGFCEGELVCIAGPAKGGKSLFLGNFARNQIMNGKNVAIITLEMHEFVYNERVTRNLLSLNKEEYRRQINDTDIFQKKLDTLNQKNPLSLIKPGEMYIKFMSTSSASIPAIENYLNKLEDHLQKKIDLVVLDYINLCSNWKNPNSDVTYMKVKTLAEDFRDLLNRKKCAGVTGTQLNREGSTSEKIHIGNISESHGLIATVDAMFATKQRTSGEIQRNEIGLYHLASRNDAKKEGVYRFEVNFDYFRITEKSVQEVMGEDSIIIEYITSDNDIFTFGET